MSAWGKAWGYSWQNAWGRVEPTGEHSTGGNFGPDIIPLARLRQDDEAILHVLMKFVTRNQYGNSL